MNMPEPRLIVENFGGFVVKKVVLELVAVGIVEPMSEVNKYGIEFASLLVGFVENFNAVDVANFESSKDSEDTFLSNIGKDMWNDYGGIFRIKAGVSCFLVFGSTRSLIERSFAVTSNRSFRRVKIHSSINFIHANMGIDQGSCIKSASRLATWNALGFLVFVIENR